jgi:hypothetical protein
MIKIVINTCFGGFGLSDEAVKLYKKLSKKKFSKDWYPPFDIKRDDPILVQVIQELGEKANGEYAELKIVSVPNGTNWEVTEYDGSETVEEVHQKWY